MSQYPDIDCTQSPEFQMLVQEAVSINSSQKRLEELAYLSIDLARLVVSNPSTSPDLLQKLAKRPDFFIHQNIVANSNTPLQTLVEVGNKYDVFNVEKGEKIDIYIFENEIEGDDMPLYNINELKFNEALYQLLEKRKQLIIKHSEYWELKRPLSKIKMEIHKCEKEIIRNYLLIHPDVNIVFLIELECNKYNLTEENVFIFRMPDTDTLKYVSKELAKIVSEELAIILASHHLTPPELLHELAKRRYDSVRREIMANPKTPVETLLKLSQKFPEELLKNPALPSILDNEYTELKIKSYNLTKLIKLDAELICKSIEYESLITVDLLEKYAKHSDYYVRYCVANHPNTPIYILENLAEDSDYYVRMTVSERIKNGGS